jgi:SAM-dependent methyltransferase
MTGLQTNDPAYWDQYWKERLREPALSRVRIGKRKILGSWIQRGARILEVGCGTGRYMRFLEEELGCEAWGIDFSLVGIEIARRNLSGLEASRRLIHGNLMSSFLPDGHFDVTLGVGIIEHLTGQDLLAFLQKRYSLTRPGGLMIDMVPNYTGYWGLRRRYFKRVKHDILFMTEFTEFKKKSLIDLYRACGLLHLQVKGQGFKHLDSLIFSITDSLPFPSLLAKNLYICGQVPLPPVSNTH